MIEIVSATALDRLLDGPALGVPHDTIDLTLGRTATFFVGKGYGFLSQQQVFCPELRAAVINALRTQPIRSFARATLAVTDQPLRTLDPRWDAQLLARSGVPAAYLAMELELCYVPLCALALLPDPDALLDALLGALPQQRGCPCASAMQATRERGLVGADWRGWL